MKIESVQVSLSATDLRIMASALRIYSRDCIMSVEDSTSLRRLVHLAERADEHEGKCFAEMIRNGEDKPAQSM